jgi:UDP-glucose 4-epimerase
MKSARATNGPSAVRRYLLTGGAGFIGSHLADALVAAGAHVVLLDDLSTGRRANVAHLLHLPSVELVEGSVLDEELVDELMGSIDACVHLASAVGVKLIVSDPLHSLLKNVRGTDIVLSAAAAHGRRLLFTSTSEVYGRNSSGALSEDSDRVIGSAFRSRWSYAIGKSFGESLAHLLHRQTGFEAIVVRLFNTIGPRQTGTYGMVVPRFVRQALSGEALTVYGDGTQTRCFSHVDDTVRALVLLLGNDLAVGRAFNVGTTNEIRILDLARRVIQRSGSTSTVRFVDYEDAYDEGFEELGRRRPDTTPLEQLTGWQPLRTLDDAIDDVIAFQQSATGVSGSARVAG